MKSRSFRLLAPVVLVALAACSEKAPPPPPKPPTVGVVRVEVVRQAVSTELPGRTKARLIAEIRPQVGGIVQQRLFEEGAQVRSGQVLYELDPASLRASVASAEATVAKGVAALAAARTTATRDAELVKIDAISRQQADTSAAALLQAEAELAAARAAAQSARIELGRARITSPIAGIVSVSSVTPGALVTANQEVALTTVQQLDPLYVDVVQSSAELLALKRDLASGTLRQRSGAGEAPFRLVLEDGTPYPHPGRLKFAGVSVDPATGAVTLRGEVPSPDGLLMPGMFVRAQLETGVAEQAILLPQQGVTRTPAGEAAAWVVGPDNKVQLRKLTVDRAVGNRWLVTAGVAPGDRVIVDGLQRTRVGGTVTPVDAAASAPAGAAAASSPGAAARGAAPAASTAR